MRQKEAIDKAVRDAIDELEEYGAGSPESQVNVLKHMAAVRFNRMVDRAEVDTDITNATVLALKIEVAIEKELGIWSFR